MHGYDVQTGAANVRRECTEAMAILRRLMAENPGFDRRALFPLFEVETRDDPAALREIKWYFFSNFHSYEAGTRHGDQSPEARVEHARRLVERVENVKRQILRMDWLLPNGKRLAECTFAEVAKCEGWLAKVAKKGKPHQLVGKVLTEADLQAIK